MTKVRAWHPNRVVHHPEIVNPNRRPTAAEIYRRIRERASAPRPPKKNR
jgi:hypothetical protein